MSASGEQASVTVDRVILAVGIQGNVEDLGLEEAAVEIDRTLVATNEGRETG